LKITMQYLRRGLGISLLMFAFLSVSEAKEANGQVVDSGAFGVYISGQRVATETFSVHQQQDGINTISSQVKQDSGPSAQSSELRVTSTGAIVRYEWKEIAPGKSSLVVVPNNEFLLETITEKPGEKPAEQPFLLAPTTPILDNNFFVHREVLAWRYLASPSCKADGTQLKCSSGEFGIVVPQGRASAQVTLRPIGEEKVTIHGSEQALLRIDLKGEDGDWSLWLNAQDHYKLMRVTKTGDPVEVVRD
jgi:hypothetical protein